jgi:hypothetical protein
MAPKGPLTEQQVSNIHISVRLLGAIFRACPEVGGHRRWMGVLTKLEELTDGEGAVRSHFGQDDAFLQERRALGWNEKFLANLWNRYILVHTSRLPDRDLDESNSEEAATLLRLAMILWHETAHWLGGQDLTIQTDEVKVLDILKDCPYVKNHPCSESLVAMIKELRRTARDDDGWWVGF